ncbi:MAG: GAF domain-containing protein [Ignavibacteriales bacterium]|nr:GAF domain-containing protein [Ignavibacteriales bacterium]
MENQLMVSLGRNKLLKNVDISKIDLRNIKGRLITIGEGEILFREGDRADVIYLVVSGEINLLKKRLLGKSKSFIFGENDFLGQEEFLEETSRTSTAVALRDSYLIALSKDEVDSLIRQEGNILLNLREPSVEATEELTGLKALIKETKEELKTTKDIWEEEKPEEKAKEEIPQDEFFQSISDSSRSDEENLVHPLEKIEETKEEKIEDSKEEINKKEEIEFEQSLFNEDGIIKAEFELPASEKEIKIEKFDAVIDEKQPEWKEPEIEEKKKTFVEEDLNDALFQALSGTTSKITNEEIHEKEIPKSITEEDQSFFASMENVETPVEKSEENILETEKENIVEAEQFIPKPHQEIPIIEESFEKDIDFEEQKDFYYEEKSFTKNVEQEIKQEAVNISSDDSSSKLTTKELEMLLRAAELVNSTVKVDEVLQNIVTVAMQLTNADRGTLYIVDKEKNELWSLIIHANEIKEIRLKIGEGLAGYSAKTGETLNIRDVQNDPRFNKDYDRASGYVTKSMICFPIKNNQSEIIGVLQLINSKNGFFTERDEIFLAALSIHSAIALQNAENVARLLQSERVHSLGKMANFLIQDIKKPILVSKRYSEHLLSKKLPAEISQVVEMILEQLNHVVDIVQTTSSYSEGKTVLRTLNVSLNNTLTDYASRIDNYVVSKSCRIVNEFDKDVTVRLDLKEFYQCYFHIIKNACDAMPEGGTIYISTKREEKKVKIFFKDNGLGIPDSVKDKIFDPFVSYGKKEGTGLGLAITKKIVDAHNGKIEFESTTGIGTTFIITLPIASLF